MIKSRLLFFSFFLSALLPLGGEEIVVNTVDGESYLLEIDPHERLIDLQDKILALSDGKSGPYLLQMNHGSHFRNWMLKFTHTKGGYLGYPRNYLVETSPDERSDIHFIVNSLANKTVIALATLKADLEAAGDRIEHLHPLRFLMTVFTDEKLKVGIRNIRAKGWVWGQFISGVKEALTTETRIGNMKDEYINHFAQVVKIDPALIKPAIEAQQWENFIDILIKNIPREGDHDRYDG